MELGYEDVYISPDFQSDQTDGFPVSLCWDASRGVAFLMLNESMADDETDLAYYVTLCSVADHALFQLLEQNPQIRKVILCLDNDDAGRQAMERITAKLAVRKYNDVSVLLPTLKDWNEDLQMDSGKLKTTPTQEPSATEGMIMQ